MLHSPIYWILSALLLAALLGGLWMAVRAMVRLNARVRERLQRRHAIEIEIGVSGTWRISRESWERHAGNRYLLALQVQAVHLSIWLAFCLTLTAALGLLIGLLYLLTRASS